MSFTASSAASPRGTLSTALRQQAAFACVLLVAIGHALPALLNAAELHSDAAIVGLQARHLLRGEWSWFLWGSGYQTSVDSLVAALFFSVLGATPLALTLSSFCGYLLLVGLAFSTLRRRFDAGPSALLVSPLVLTTGPLHTYMFSPPRQASLTLVFAAIWLIDGAPRWRYRAGSLAAGACVAGLSCFADPYALVFLPGMLGFLLLCAIEPSEHRARGVAAGTLGAVAGLVPLWLLTHSPHASHGVLGLHTAVIAHNLRLLGQTCLPYLLGTTAYFSPRAPIVQAWPAPDWFHVLQLAGAGLLLLGITYGGFSAVMRPLPRGIRRLAALGAVMLPVTLGAFSVSVMVMDRLSARYLVAMVLMAPFALAPALARLGPRRFALLLAPYLLSSAVAGWLECGTDVDRVHLLRHGPSVSDEARLHQLLHEQGLTFGVADYWVAYRLDFLFDEQQIVVPWHEALDRYSPYRRLVASQARVAYIFDPWRSKEDLATREEAIRNGQTEFAPRFQSLRSGRYTVLILQREGTTRQTLLDGAESGISSGDDPFAWN